MDEHTRLAPLNTDQDLWDFLMTRRGRNAPYTKDDVIRLTTLAHQGFAVAHAVDQLLRLDAVHEALRSDHGSATHIAPDDVTEVPPVDTMRDLFAGLHSAARKVRGEISRVSGHALAQAEAIGLKRRQLQHLRSGPVVASAFVMLGAARLGLRPTSPLELEVIARITEDRGSAPPRSLLTVKDRSAARDVWKKTRRKARALLPLLKKIGHESGRTP